MSHSAIRKSFNDIVRSYGASKGWEVVLENSVATPTLNIPYLKTFLLPASATSETLSGDHKRYIGVYQITLVLPAGEGTGRVTTVSQELQELFPVYGRVDYSTAPDKQVVIMTPLDTINGTVKDGAFYTPLSFNYRSDIN